MKKLYTFLFVFIFISYSYTQTFEFSIEYMGINSTTNNHQIALVATPNSGVSNGVTADMGAGFYIPIGLTIGNFVTGNSGIPASEWSSQTLGASNSNGDSYFVSRSEAGSSSVILNGNGPFELVLFDIIADPNPTSGEIKFVENGDPIFNEILFIENYFEINLGSGTTSAYSGNNPSSSTISFSTLNSDDLILDRNISVFPNPTSSLITINSTLTTDLTSIEVFDITGKKLNEKLITNKNGINTIDLSTYPSGLLLLKINGENSSLTKKIIKN